MGAFFTNLHVKCDDGVDPVAMVATLNLGPAYISDIENGWLSIYPQKTEEQDDTQLSEICTQISQLFTAPAIAFLVNDSDVFMYFLADAGEIVDAYVNDPGFYDESDSEPSGGDIPLVLKHCLPGTETAVLESLLKERKYKGAPLSEEMQKELAEEIATRKQKLLVKYAAMAQVPPEVELVKEKVPDIEEMLAFLESDIRAAYGDTDLVSAEDQAAVLAELLGIPDWRVPIGYRYIEEGEATGPLTEICAESDIVAVSPNEKGWVLCPNCERHFSAADKRAFDGRQHTSCGQRLAIAN